MTPDCKSPRAYHKLPQSCKNIKFKERGHRVKTVKVVVEKGKPTFGRGFWVSKLCFLNSLDKNLIKAGYVIFLNNICQCQITTPSSRHSMQAYFFYEIFTGESQLISLSLTCGRDTPPLPPWGHTQPGRRSPPGPACTQSPAGICNSSEMWDIAHSL